MRYRTAEFGPIMNAGAWLGKNQFTIKTLSEKLESIGEKCALILIQRENGNVFAVLGFGGYDSTVKHYQRFMDGKRHSYYYDTGKGHIFPNDGILVVDIMEVNKGEIVKSFRESLNLSRIHTNLKVKPYVFK